MDSPPDTLSERLPISCVRDDALPAIEVIARVLAPLGIARESNDDTPAPTPRC